MRAVSCKVDVFTSILDARGAGAAVSLSSALLAKPLMTALPKPEWKTCTETSATISVAAPAGAVIEYKEYPEEWSAARTVDAADVAVTIPNLNPGSTYNFRLAVGDDKGPELVVDTQGAPAPRDRAHARGAPRRSAELHAEAAALRHTLRGRLRRRRRRGARGSCSGGPAHPNNLP